MLQAIRNRIHGWPATLLLVISSVAASAFGIERYFTDSSTDVYVAKVGDGEVSQKQFQDALNRIRQQDSERLGDRFDPTLYEKADFKQQLLDGLIDRQLILQTAKKLHMQVSIAAVQGDIAATPSFQVNGLFDPNTYRAVLAQNGLTPGGYENSVRDRLAASLLPDVIERGASISEADIDQYLQLRLQRRDLRYLLLPRPALTDSQVSDQQIDDYYKAHRADFMSPEQVSLKYLEVNGADLEVDTEPTDEALTKRYDEERQRFVKPEQREVSHILIDVPKNATPEQQKMALAKAEKIAAGLGSENFASMAREQSADLGSKALGGDLGWLEKGVANAAFDSVLFSMQKGQISKPVLSEEGYHILWLRDVRPGDVKPFEEVRAQLRQELKATARERAYNELAGKLTDQAYQNPVSLEPAAQALHLPIKQTALFAKQGGEGIAANAKVIAAVFSDDVMTQGNNSGLIELEPRHAVVIHVDKHVPSALKPLAEVHEQIRTRILDQRVHELARQDAAKRLERLRGGEDMRVMANALGSKVLTVPAALRMPTDRVELPEALRKAAFLLPHPIDGKPQYGDAELDHGHYALLAVDQVLPADLSKLAAEERDALRRSMAQAYGYIYTREFLNAVRADTKITIDRERM